MSEPWWDRVIVPGVQPDVREGVWQFHTLNKDRFFGEYLSHGFLSELLESARNKGWRTAVEDSLRLLPPRIAAYTQDYFLAPYRASFVDRLGLGNGSHVLDLGCGWGFASQRCLELGACVVGTDAALGRLQFCSIRFGQQRLDDRFLGIEMDANRSFPFRSGAFDALIVSGLMEWLPSTGSGDAESIQRVFLERCFSALRLGGRMYLAIENRWWWKYFLGARDLHRVDRFQVFTSILPRSLARVWMRALSGQDYRTYTYSFFQYLEMLKAAGFTAVDADYPEPDYVQPRQVLPLVRGLKLTGTRRDWSHALRAQHSPRDKPLFGRSFMFVATK